MYNWKGIQILTICLISKGLLFFYTPCIVRSNYSLSDEFNGGVMINLNLKGYTFFIHIVYFLIWSKSTVWKLIVLWLWATFCIFKPDDCMNNWVNTVNNWTINKNTLVCIFNELFQSQLYDKCLKNIPFEIKPLLEFEWLISSLWMLYT
jgi:hypothetical protein